MRLKDLRRRARLLLRRRASPTTTMRAGQVEAEPRVWSLMLPLGFPPDRK
jgi:hypothetical protein